MPVQVGTRLGPYEIVAAVGAGGMGEVFRARDTKLNRDVALKVLPPAFVHDRDRLSRFEREAQSLAALNHPHIAQIYGVVELPAALVMEFVDGEDLSARISRGAIPWQEALPIAIQIAEAVEYAHERGIVHRDLKPANIKITESGSVKVLDFGLAKAMAPDPAQAGVIVDSPTFTSPATQLGVILGTAAYMAPEQAKGKPVDRRADVWAFGGVVFEMLAGRRAFDGEDVTDVIASIMRAEPDWTALPSDTPSAIRKLLRRCLEKDRGKRLDSMSVARYEIQEALAAPEPQSAAPPVLPPVRPFWRSVIPFFSTAVVAAALASALVWSARPHPARPVVRFAITLPEGQSLVRRVLLSMALSPDGKRLAYTGFNEVFIRTLDSMEPARLFSTDAGLTVSNLAFSPDGQTLAFAAGGSILRIPASGGAPTTVAANVDPNGITWNGDMLYYASGNKVMRMRAAGGERETLLTLGDDELALWPHLLPDGRTLLFTVTKGTSLDRWDNASIVAQRIGQPSRRTIVARAAEPRYLPTGRLVYVQGGVLFAAPFDARALEITGDAVPVVEGVARAAGMLTGRDPHFAVSDTGTLAYLPGPAESGSRVSGNLVYADAGGNVELLKLPPNTYAQPRCSPDGRSIAFVIEDGKESSIWVYDVKAGGSARRLTFGGSERSPVWSHDGTHVAYQSRREGDEAIFLQRADGSDASNPARLTKPEPGVIHLPQDWSPDGSVLLFDSVRGESVSLMVLKRADGSTSPFGGVASQTLTTPAFSPDGKWVAYTVRKSEHVPPVVFVQPFPATGALFQVSKTSEYGHHPVWSEDGSQLFYTPGPGHVLVSVPVTTTPVFDMGEAKALNRQFTNAPPQTARTYDVAPDGRFLGVVTAQSRADTNTVMIVLNWFDELQSRVK